MKPPKVPNTITDRQMRDLTRRAQWAHRKESWIDKKAVNRRLSSTKQANKARWS